VTKARERVKARTRKSLHPGPNRTALAPRNGQTVKPQKRSHRIKCAVSSTCGGNASATHAHTRIATVPRKELSSTTSSRRASTGGALHQGTKARAAMLLDPATSLEGPVAAAMADPARPPRHTTLLAPGPRALATVFTMMAVGTMFRCVQTHCCRARLPCRSRL